LRFILNIFKIKHMKKLFAVAIAATLFTACGGSDEETPADDMAATTDQAAPASDTPAAASNAPMKDSLMIMKDGKVMIAIGGQLQPLAEPLVTHNGRTVKPGGEVSKGDKKRTMEEGQMIDIDGQMMDKDGKLMDNTGW
jgi:hypothetical protein